VASVKAALLNLVPHVPIVDISHHVRPFDIHGAAFMLRSVWQQFPMGSVHVIGVQPEYAANQAHLVIQYLSHFFIGADNGIFGLLFDEQPEDIFEITLPQGDDWNFPMKGVFAVCAAHLAKSGAPEFLGRRITTYKKPGRLIPTIEENQIMAYVAHIDHYGNVYTNLERATFEMIRNGRDFEIIPKRISQSIRKISASFHEGRDGDVLAFWASNGLMMLAIRNGAVGSGGGFAGLFGFHVNDSLRIELHGEANR